MPRHRTLDGFVDAVSQADGIGLTDVDALTTLMVRTDNSVYQITILQPYAREVVVQGGAFFPERTRACLSGSSFGGSCLKLGWVGIGLHYGVPCRGPVGHHVARSRDCGRAVRARATLLTALNTTRTNGTPSLRRFQTLQPGHLSDLTGRQPGHACTSAAWPALSIWGAVSRVSPT